MIVQTAINPNYKGKVSPGDPQWWRFNMTFTNYKIALDRIAKAISLGFCLTAPHRKVRHHRPRANNKNYHTTYRVKANVESVQFIGLDCDTKDERSTFQWWIANDMMAREYGLMYTTSSHTPENPKCRILVPISEPVSVEVYEKVIRQIQYEYNKPDDVIIDKSCKDANRLWFGSVDCELRMPLVDGGVPVEFVMDRYVKAYDERIAKVQAEREAVRKERELRAKSVVVSDSIVHKYVLGAIDNQLNRLENAREGTGERHNQLLCTSSSLMSLVKSPWAYGTGLLEGIKDKIVLATRVNKYIEEYGEETVLRAISDMEREAEPVPMPVFDCIGKGSVLDFNFRGNRVSGVVEGSRKYEDGWYYKVGGTYYHEGLVR